ncbi:MAG: dTDP-4-amino-4,6-dideoxygalactose transaminase [Acidobacteriota bacterium]|nr:dTDP-4-amino-4,6-dideoxygalactose transaminase [Acidobacteriota bacterium]
MTDRPNIPFNRASLAGRELAYMRQALERGHISGDGEFSKRCHALLERETGAGKALLTTSCTHALEMAALLLGLAPGDEVVVPSFAFVTTANAFVLRGARPAFVDIRPDTLNMDETRLEAALNDRTRAVVALHYAGVGCAMDAIMDVASRRRGLAVVEDNAHGLFGRYQGRQLGTFGAMAALSFHETKNFTCGEGGALLLNDPALFERAEILREKGTNRSRFFRGQVDKYTWVDLGSSYLPSDLLAAFLLAQLEEAATIQARRRSIWLRYFERLSPWAERAGARLPVVPAGCESAFHLFHVLLPSPEKRDALMNGLKERGILAVFHYLPLHLSPMGRSWGYRKGDFPVSEDISGRLLRLPFYNSLESADQERICGEIEDLTRSW